jgi:hypothetical protein
MRVDSTGDNQVDAGDNNTFNLAVDKDTGAITVTKLATPSTDADTPYNRGDHFTITAKDADGFDATTEVIKVQRNRAPTKASSGTVVTAATDALVVGNQPAIELVDTTNKEQTSTDACDVADKDRLNVVCISKDDVEMAFGTDGDTNVTYSARSKNPLHASAVASDGRLIITGHMPLKANDAVTDIKVFLKATDSGGLDSEEHEILVRVDPMPVVGALPASVSVKATGTATSGVLRGISGFITSKDQGDEDEGLTLTLVEADGTAPDGSVSNAYFSAEIANGNLNITGSNETTSPIAIVILAEETGQAPNQWVKHTVMVTVTSS